MRKWLSQIWHDDRRSIKSRAKALTSDPSEPQVSATVTSQEQDQLMQLDDQVQLDVGSNSDQLDATEELFCLCRQPNNPNEPYAQCSRCNGWFHPQCVGFKSIIDIEVISPWFCTICRKGKCAQGLGEKSKDSVRKKLNMEEEQQNNDLTNLNTESKAPHCPSNFTMHITKEEWEKIQPDRKQGYQTLKKGWSELFSSKMNEVNKCCVLCFKYNRVKSNQSRKKSTVYWHGKAVCKFPGCTKYTLTIPRKPHKNQINISIRVHVIGGIYHSGAEMFKRHCRQTEREHLKSKLGEFTPMHLHTKQLTVADEVKVKVGNMNDIKSLPVLQKISSEKNLEKLPQ